MSANQSQFRPRQRGPALVPCCIPQPRARGWLLCLGLFLSLAVRAGAASFPLVRDEQSAATIVLAAEATEAARFAAGELLTHVEKITGVRLPVANDAGEVPGPRILVGESAATRKLGLGNADFQPQEYLVRFGPDTLVLMGRDDPRPAAGSVTVLGSPKWTEGHFDRGLAFDGGHDALTVPGGAFSDDFGSLEAWVQLAPGERGLGTILRLDGAAAGHALEQLPKSRRLRYATHDGQAGSSVESGELDDGWHYILATHDAESGRIELFLDGVSQGTAKYAKTACAGATLQIGARVGSNLTNLFAGQLDEVRVSLNLRSAIRGFIGGALDADADTALLLSFEEGRGVPHARTGLLASAPPPDIFTAQGTCYAVYDFLERFCGVRWYSPGDLGLVHPVTNTLAVAGTEIRRRPAFAYRMPEAGAATCLKGTQRMLWNNPSPKELNLFWHRLRIGGQAYAAGHSFDGCYDRFWQKNPEKPGAFESAHADWFAQGYSNQPPQMCYTSTGFIAQVVREANDYFDGRGLKPGAKARDDYFALVPMDNGAYCKCPVCQAEMDQAEWKNLHFSRGAASDYVFGFVNKVAKQVASSHPGQYLAALAYAEYARHPRHVRLEPNVSVQLCLHVRNWWSPAMETNDLAFYRDWVAQEKGRPLYLWLYYCFPQEMGEAKGFNWFPGFFAHTQARQFKMFARDGIRGAYLNGLGELVDTYVAFKLLDDPNLDVDALLDELFTRYYGGAAEPMKQFYLRIESVYSTPANYPPAVQTENRHFQQTEEIAWGWLGTSAVMKDLGELLEQAQATATTQAEFARVQLFEQSVWQHILAGRKHYEATKAGKPAR